MAIFPSPSGWGYTVPSSWQYTFSNASATVTSNVVYNWTWTVDRYWHEKCRKKARVYIFCAIQYPEGPLKKCHGCGKSIARRVRKAQAS